MNKKYLKTKRVNVNLVEWYPQDSNRSSLLMGRSTAFVSIESTFFLCTKSTRPRLTRYSNRKVTYINVHIEMFT